MSNKAPATPMKLTVDLSKPKGEREAYEPMSAEELAQSEVDGADYQARKDSENKIEEARRVARDSASSKLAALGLTTEEILAITGA